MYYDALVLKSYAGTLIYVALVFVTMTRQRYVSSKTDPLYKKLGWHETRVGFEKDGYEIYLMRDGGLELTVRDPESGEREPIVRREDLGHKQPLAVAIVCHLLENAEDIVVSHNEQEDGNN